MSKLRYDVYLACRMHFRQVADVLLQVNIAKAMCKQYGLTYYSPGDDEGLSERPRTSIIDGKPDLKTMKGYVIKDDYNLDKCRTLLVLTGDTSSSGVAWEMARMYYKNHRPIVLVAPKMFKEELTNFSTIKATALSITIEEGIRHIVRILKRRPNAIYRSRNKS